MEHLTTTLVSRRDVIKLGGVTAAGLAGCLSPSDTGTVAAPDAIALSGNKECDVCGMVIGAHPGPNAQIHYRRHSPEGHPNPAWFDSVKACMLQYYFEHRGLGWEALEVYATDYSRVDYQVTTTEGKQFVSSHTAADAFEAADDMYFVVGSSVNGAMGPDFIPFSGRSDAAAFVENYGGRRLGFGDITPELLARQ